MNNKKILISCGTLGVMLIASFGIKMTSTESRNLQDEALLSIIKNDGKAFQSFLRAGGNIHSPLPEINGKVFTVGQGIVEFERIEFLKILKDKKISFKDKDLLQIAVNKNNPQILKILMEGSESNISYGENGWSLLHIASASCSDKVVSFLHTEAKMNWDLKAKDGSTPLTIAAEKDCLPLLSYWKENKADFKEKDGRGITALSVLNKKKDAAIVAFANSFAAPARVPTAAVVPKFDFYKKRKFPKVKEIDYASMIEPDIRPDEANDTSEFSEFSD